MAANCNCGRGPNCQCGNSRTVRRDDSLPSYESLFPSHVPPGPPAFGAPPPGPSAFGAPPPGPPAFCAPPPAFGEPPPEGPIPGVPPPIGYTPGTLPPVEAVSSGVASGGYSEPPVIHHPFSPPVPPVGFTFNPLPSSPPYNPPPHINTTYTLPSYNTAGPNAVIYPPTVIPPPNINQSSISSRTKSCFSVFIVLVFILVVVRLFRAMQGY